VGQTTPLSNKRTRVGKQPRHIRQSKFLTLGGTFRFQIPDQYPGRHRWKESIKFVTHSLYALRIEQRSCLFAFQIILSSSTWEISGVWSTLFATSALKTCVTSCSFQLLSCNFVRLLILKLWSKWAPGASLPIISSFGSHGSLRMEMFALVPILH